MPREGNVETKSYVHVSCLMMNCQKIIYFKAIFLEQKWRYIASNQNKSGKIGSIKHLAYMMRRQRSAWSGLQCIESAPYKYKTEAWGLGTGVVAFASRGQRLGGAGGLSRSRFLLVHCQQSYSLWTVVHGPKRLLTRQVLASLRASMAWVMGPLLPNRAVLTGFGYWDSGSLWLVCSSLENLC